MAEQPVDLTQSVRLRIREAFTGLIPEDLWDQMIKDEWDSLFKPRKYTDYHRKNDVRPSVFSELIETMLIEMMKEKLQPILHEAVSSVQWDRNYGPSEVLSEVVKACAPEMMEALVAKVLSLYSYEFAEAVKKQ